ncbi:hypothetical protein AB0D57_06450 [Streptomyces sp. NPDC048275]|uniref:NucA/NucB deoxyribonuclease domain-containing protein n=1 Tax=Streptomyces sp. NPDC048275 TaxID=3155629 RepID=UPI0033DB5C24
MKKRYRALAVIAGLLLTFPSVQASAISETPTTRAESLYSDSPQQFSTAADTQVSSNCESVRSSLKRLLSRHPDKYASCVAPGPVTDARNALAGEISTRAIVDIPEWCKDHAFDGWWMTRTQACMIRTVTVNVWDLRGRLVGQLHANEYNYSYTVPDLTRWAYQIQVSKLSTSWGRVGGAMVSGHASCSGACRLLQSLFPPQVVKNDGEESGEAYFNSTATTRGSRGDSRAQWKYQYNSTQWVLPPEEINSVAPVTRGDHALPGRNTRPGVVFPESVPTMRYSLTGSYPELAKHIQEAQKSGLPGGTKAKPLTRITGSAVTRNRDRSCPRGPNAYPRPSGKTCDEYPMASTRQGASTARPRGPARTYDPIACHIAEPVRRGPRGYSVCMINGSQNRDGGNALNRFYIDQRVLADDEFTVVIEP